MKEKLPRRDNRKIRLTPRVAAWLVAAVALMIAVAASVGLFGGSSQSIALPSGSAQPSRTTQEEQRFTLSDADITVDNVQQVIADLSRPEAYSMAIDNTVFWAEDWSTCQVNQYVLNGVCLTEFLDTTQEIERYEMIADDQYYSWRVGKKKYHTGSTGSLTADQTGMIPTYETIVETDKELITDAGLRTVNEIPCVYCAVQDTQSGYQITYCVSTVTGLLMQAEYTRGDELVRSVNVTSVDTNPPDSSRFLLPDGTDIVTNRP